MSGHVATKQSYFAVFGALAVLTVLTVAVSFIDLGWSHLVVALAIAATKAVLVGLFFMHLWHSKRLIWVVAGAGFFWLVIMMVLTLSDYLTRNWSGPMRSLPESQRIEGRESN